MPVKDVHLKDESATRHLGAVIARNVSPGTVIALLGDLGAGKTTLTQGLAAELAVAEMVSSPTFLMLNEYHSGRLPLCHFDLYRLQEDVQSQSALFQLKSDLDEVMMGGAIAVVEWLDLWEDFASDYVQVRVQLFHEQANVGRRASISATGAGNEALLEKILQGCQV